MYRANDPRFRRRLNEIGQTLENANESAQSNIYIFTQNYIKPCIGSITSGVTACVEASCPTLNLSSRDRLRRQRGRTRGRAELNFDFYDDWDEDENDALLGWGGDEDLDRLLAGSGSYGTVTASQPSRQRAMNYPKGRRISAALPHDVEADPTVIPGSGGFFGKLFGGKALRYKPSAAGLQEHPNIRRPKRQPTEGEALLEEHSEGGARRHGRRRSGTVGSGHTTDSLSSRGDIFPSDGEDDAVPLDDEFAMVLERRTTHSGGQDDRSSGHTHEVDRKRGKRPSAGSRTSSGRRTFSTRSRKSTGSELQTPVEDTTTGIWEGAPSPPGMVELKREEQSRVTQDEEGDVGESGRDGTERSPAESGVASLRGDELSSKEATPQVSSHVVAPPSADVVQALALDDAEQISAAARQP